MTKALIYQLKICLDKIQPSIWHRIQVPGGISVLKLHFILQLAMGWTNSHLHKFLIDEQNYGDPDDDEFDTRQVRDERDYLLEEVLLEKGQVFSYLCTTLVTAGSTAYSLKISWMQMMGAHTRPAWMGRGLAPRRLSAACMAIQNS